MEKVNGTKQQTTKRCHWVPQAYLRVFAAETRHRKIWRLSKLDDGGEPELKPIAKVAVRFYLYAPKDPRTGIVDDRMERKLSDLEQFIGDPIWQALCNEHPDLSWEPARKMVSLIVAVMHLRNPAHLNKHKEIHNWLVKTVTEEGAVPERFEYRDQTCVLDADSWPAFRDASEHDVQRIWLDDLSSAAWYATELMKMRWTILCADKPTFITSDNPVTIVHPSLRFRGISDPQTIVMFPLSPTRMLTMDHLHNEPRDAYYNLADDGAAQNILIWRGANEHMFSSRHPDEVCRDFLRSEERLLAAAKGTKS